VTGRKVENENLSVQILSPTRTVLCKGTSKLQLGITIQLQQVYNFIPFYSKVSLKRNLDLGGNTHLKNISDPEYREGNPLKLTCL
jgi:hypothetical protein